MQCKTLGQLTVGIYIASLMVFAAVLPSEAQVRRLVFASAGFNESNRFWIIGRPAHLQFDPFLETLLDVHPETGAYIPRLAEKWRVTPDLKDGPSSCVKVSNSTSAMASSPRATWCIRTP